MTFVVVIYDSSVSGWFDGCGVADSGWGGLVWVAGLVLVICCVSSGKCCYNILRGVVFVGVVFD